MSPLCYDATGRYRHDSGCSVTARKEIRRNELNPRIHPNTHNATLHKALNANSTLQPENTRQLRPSFLSQLRMSRLPPLHTAVTDTGANALNITSTIFTELRDLQQVRPQPRGTDNMIKNLLVGLQRGRPSRGA